MSRWSTLSHGERKRAQIAIALWQDPELLAIDEATQGLRAVLQRYATAVAVVDTGSPLALVNLNTPEDYQQALRLASQ